MSMSEGNHRAQTVEVYRLWWQHDAHWYQEVAKRFGQTVANEVNAEAIRKVAVQIGRRVARHCGPLPESGDRRKDLAELRRRYDECGDRMFPRELRSVFTEVEGDDLIVRTLTRNFAITMVRMAGALEGYQCPCTDIHAGWSEGLGVTLSENRAASCLGNGEKACRVLLRVAAPDVGADAEPVADAGSVPPSQGAEG
jgi:hypothetical protein